MMNLFNRNKRTDQDVHESDYIIEENTSSFEVHQEDHEIIDIDMNNKQFPTGNKSADLIILVGKAIDAWAKEYNLTKMPKKVVLGQALALLNAWYKELS